MYQGFPGGQSDRQPQLFDVQRESVVGMCDYESQTPGHRLSLAYENQRGGQMRDVFFILSVRLEAHSLVNSFTVVQRLTVRYPKRACVSVIPPDTR